MYDDGYDIYLAVARGEPAVAVECPHCAGTGWTPDSVTGRTYPAR